MCFKRFRNFLWLIILSSKVFGQDYIQYQKTFNRIDDDLTGQNYPLALDRLDSIEAGYKFVYGKHCVKALQICVLAKDTAKAGRWLAKCFTQGIPLWMIRSNALTRPSLAFPNTRNTIKLYDSLRQLYKNALDTNLLNRIDSLLAIDQKFTRKVNDGFVLFRITIHWLQWRKNNKKQYEILVNMIREKGYPGEQLIGLEGLQDSASFYKHYTFWGPSEIREAKVQIMLQHCYSTGNKANKVFRNVLLKEVYYGHLPAYQFAIIHDFMIKGSDIGQNTPYHAHNHNLNSDQLFKIDQNRLSIGLTALEQERKNTEISRERRKNRTVDSTVVREY